MDAHTPRRRRRGTGARPPAAEQPHPHEPVVSPVDDGPVAEVPETVTPEPAPEAVAAAEFGGGGGRLDLLPLGMAAGVMALLAVCALLALAAA
jgi:hypothetical protein